MKQTAPEYSAEFINILSELSALDAVTNLYEKYEEFWQNYTEEDGKSFYERYPEFVVETRALLIVLSEKHDLNFQLPQLRTFSMQELAKFDTFMHELCNHLQDSKLRILADSFEKSFRQMLLSAKLSTPDDDDDTRDLLGSLEMLLRREHM